MRSDSSFTSNSSLSPAKPDHSIERAPLKVQRVSIQELVLKIQSGQVNHLRPCEYSPSTNSIKLLGQLWPKIMISCILNCFQPFSLDKRIVYYSRRLKLTLSEYIVVQFNYADYSKLRPWHLRLSLKSIAIISPFLLSDSNCLIGLSSASNIEFNMYPHRICGLPRGSKKLINKESLWHKKDRNEDESTSLDIFKIWTS